MYITSFGLSVTEGYSKKKSCIVADHRRVRSRDSLIPRFLSRNENGNL